MKVRNRMRHTGRYRRHSTQRAHGGQALVEFAIIGLILATMSFAVVEFGRAYYASVAVTNAARDGARVAMDPSNSNADIIAAAEASAGSIELTSVDVDRSTTVGETSTITASYGFTSTLPIVSQFWGGGVLEITHSSTSRVGWD
jgi:Flp pilus assembly protein TadG